MLAIRGPEISLGQPVLHAYRLHGGASAQCAAASFGLCIPLVNQFDTMDCKRVGGIMKLLERPALMGKRSLNIRVVDGQ